MSDVTKKLLRVLLLEDSVDGAILVERALGSTGREIALRRVDSAAAMREALATEQWDLVLSGSSMPGFTAPDALRLLHDTGLDIPFVIVSETVDEDLAVAAMQAGAHDYVLRDNLTRLAAAVERELRQVEVRNQLRQAQKMEAMGRLAGGVAHDFNNILSVILCHAELLRDEPALPPELRSEVEEIRLAGTRAAALTRQLLMFSRRQVSELTVLDLNEVIAGMEKMLRRMVGEDVMVTAVRSGGLGRIRVDRGQLEQVIMNLVVNARDAMPRGGRLRLETASVTLGERDVRNHLGTRTGPHVMLAVIDSGTGIAPEILDRIFEPFFTTKDKSKGTGLGLSTVFGIVKSFGGSIRVDSPPGAGASFKIYLPRVDDAVEPARTRRVATSLRGSETVLLVEDERGVRAVTADILRRNGYHVVVAADPTEGLRLARDHAGAIQVLLTDVVMPGMSGPDLAGDVLRLRPDIAVICMSGYIDDSIARPGPGFAFIQKPITPDLLLRKLREVLDR